jgi:branched-chain amino acid transport system ATP-binding protein
VLEVADVVVRYGRIPALKGVSFQVRRGETVLLMGPNGAGKSTMANSIAGLLVPERGAITFNGASLRRPPHEVVRCGVSLVAEGRRIFPLQSVEDNVQLGGFVHRHDRRLVSETMDEVWRLFPVLRAKRTALASTLSGGEQQMLAVGQALMARPSLLICDEPSLGLSPRAAEALFARLGEVNRSGTTILLLEQRVRMALPIAHRGYIMETGSITFEGDRRALERNPRVMEGYLGSGQPDPRGAVSGDR